MDGKGEFLLTVAADEGRSTRQLSGRFLKKLARDFFSLPPGLWNEDVRGVHGALVGLVRGMDKRQVLALLRRPQLHVFLCCLHTALSRQERAVARARAREFLFQLLFELTLDGRLLRPIRWDAAAPLPRLLSPSHRVAFDCDPLCSDFVFGPGSSLPGGISACDEEVFLAVGDTFVLSLRDANPMSDFEAHPDKEGNQLSLGEAGLGEWTSSLTRAVALIAEILPGLHREMQAVFQQFIPVGTDDERHLSASYQESIGTAYLTLHPKRMTMVEAIVHEFQHNKVNMLFHVEPVLENAFFPLYASPLRPDPRPLHGVLLAAHAFVPVAELYRRLLHRGHAESKASRFRERFAQIVGINSAALDVLVEHGRPTAKGKALIDEMVSLNRTHQEALC